MTDVPKWLGGTNGWAITPINVLSTELNTLATGNTVLSSVGGSSGVFSQTQTLGYSLGVLSFVAGGSFTPTGSPFLAVWFATLADNTNYEKVLSNADQGRAADAQIPLLATAYASGDVSSSGLIVVPSIPFKVLTRSGAGVSLPGSGNLLKLGLVSLTQ